MSKIHRRHPDKEGPHCGSLAGFYKPIVIALWKEQVTCERCVELRKREQMRRGIQQPKEEPCANQNIS